jgi:hypothetical protein
LAEAPPTPSSIVGLGTGASAMRAGIAKRIARSFSRCRSGIATVHALAHASSKVNATASRPGWTPSITSRAISSHVTER